MSEGTWLMLAWLIGGLTLFGCVMGIWWAIEDWRRYR